MGRISIRAGKWVDEELSVTELEKRHLQLVLLIVALALIATTLAVIPDGWLLRVWAVLRAYAFPWGLAFVGIGIGAWVCR